MRNQNELALLALTLAAGTVIPIQAGLNAALAQRLGNTVLAAFVNFFSGAVVVSLILTAMRQPLPSLLTIQSVPPRLWAGGSLGVLLVVTAAYVAPRLGASVMIGFILASQLITSLILDHYGLVGFQTRPITPGRLGGIALLIAGMFLLRKF